MVGMSLVEFLEEVQRLPTKSTTVRLFHIQFFILNKSET